MQAERISAQLIERLRWLYQNSLKERPRLTAWTFQENWKGGKEWMPVHPWFWGFSKWIWTSLTSKFTQKPANIDFQQLQMLRVLFWIKLAKCICTDDILVNVDESIFSRNTTLNYSWSKRGQEAEFRSTRFWESISMIAAVFSTGQYFIHLRVGSVDSGSFVEFLDDLRKYIKADRWFKHKSISILLDNAPTHRAKISIEALKENFDRLIFIPPYTPQYAPVEHFFWFLKSDLKAYNGDKMVSLRNGEGEKIQPKLNVRSARSATAARRKFDFW